MGLFSLSETTVPGFYQCDFKPCFRPAGHHGGDTEGGRPAVQRLPGGSSNTGDPWPLPADLRETPASRDPVADSGGGAGATAPPRGSMVEKAG